MNVDLPPLSDFTPDPAVARARTTRDTLTLAPQAEQGVAVIRHEVMSGTVNRGPAPAQGSASCRFAVAVAVAVAQDLPLTITF
jgi:hypothetical protein